MTLPEQVKVGPYVYKIEEWDQKAAHANEKMGECSHIEMVIRVAIYPGHTANTLLHEIMHACYETWNIDDEDNQERTVTALSHALQAVWRDNPEVIRFLDQEISR